MTEVEQQETTTATPLTFTNEDTATIYWGEHAEFDTEPVHSEMTDERRWGHSEERVYRHTATGRHFSVCMYIMSGDGGDHEAEGEPCEVWSHEVTVVVWKSKPS